MSMREQPADDCLHRNYSLETVSGFVQAYLRMAKKHHPDAAAASGGESAGNSTKQFLQAKTAYEYLQEHCTK